MLNYYRAYIKDYSVLGKPLFELLQKDVSWSWTDVHESAFRSLIAALAQENVGVHHVDPALPFVLHTDWSVDGISAVLGQRGHDGQEKLVACISRSLNSCEKKYPAWKGELLAIVWALRTLRPYLVGSEFTIYTDHRPLLWLMQGKELNSHNSQGSC